MAEQVIERSATTSASPGAVYALLADGSTWPVWSPIDSFELIEPGDGSPEGLGAVRLFTTGRHKSRERVVVCEPAAAFSYELEKGLPLRDYRAVITLTPVRDGTRIEWRSTFRAKVPGTGWIYRRALDAFIGQTVDGLAHTATRDHAAPGAAAS